VKDDKKHDHDDAGPPPPSVYQASRASDGSCETKAYEWVRTSGYTTSWVTQECRSDERETQLNACSGEDCREVRVDVHYMLSEDIGEDQFVVVEAFDNPRFAGQPATTGLLNGFDATGPGEHDGLTLQLTPGEYYLRAYVSTGSENTLPYEYGDMQLVSDHPVGIFGAGSAPVKVDLRGDADTAQSVDIYLDKLFKRKGAGEGTAAFLRVELAIADGVDIPVGGKVLVELFDNDDFAYAPVHSFEIATENFLVEGRRGRTELVTPELGLGRFYLRAYLDASGNGFWDEAEPVATYMTGGIKGLLEIKAKRTESVALTLQSPQP
jgi:hypothetical protein